VGVDLSLAGPVQQPGRALGPVQRCHGSQPRCTGWPRWSATVAAPRRRPPDGSAWLPQPAPASAGSRPRFAAAPARHAPRPRGSGSRTWLTPSSSACLGCLAFPPAWPTSWEPASPEAGDFVKRRWRHRPAPGSRPWSRRSTPCPVVMSARPPSRMPLARRRGQAGRGRGPGDPQAVLQAAAGLLRRPRRTFCTTPQNPSPTVQNSP
jgi:hypothetical protein